MTNYATSITTWYCFRVRGHDGPHRNYLGVTTATAIPEADRCHSLIRGDSAVLTPVAPEVPPRGLREALTEMTLAFHTFNGRCTTDLPSCQSTFCVRAKHALAATRTPEPPDSGDGGIDLAAILDEMDARIAEDDGKVPRSGWMTAEQIKQRGSLRGQSAAVGWLRNRLGLRSGSPAPEGGE